MYYVPHTAEDKQNMLTSMGLKHIDDLFADINPSIRNPKLQIADGMDPISLLRHVDRLAARNTYESYLSFLGAGAYDHFIPSLVTPLVSRGEFLTAYTPYQPEMSQGLLQAIFEYQTMICELTGMDISNASLYDGSTAIWEAVLMAVRTTKRQHIAVLSPMNPAYLEVLKTHAHGAGVQVDICEAPLKNINDQVACVVHQYPNFLGGVEDVTACAKKAAEAGALWISVVNPLALTLFASPASMGADIIVGEGQPLGVPVSYGGPYFGFLAAKEKFLRQFPGRICGETKDKNGKRGFVLTIQTREQHIRREKATSSICTNQSLLALRAAIHMSYMGFNGLKAVATGCAQRMTYLCEQLKDIPGMQRYTQGIVWHECAFQLPCSVNDLTQRMMDEEKIIPGLALPRYTTDGQDVLLICVTEKKDKNDIDRLCAALKKHVAALQMATV